LGWWARRSAARADRIVCSSASSAAAVAEASGVELGRIEVRPIPAAVVEAMKVDHRERIERVLLVGDVYGYKRWEHAIEAAATFAVQVARPLLVIHIGTGRDAAAMTRLDRAIEAGASSGVAVERRGALPHAEVLAAMIEADVVMLTSTAETQGLPLVEALSVGLPVVCRDLDVFVEQGGDAAVFVAGGATEFAAALADLDDRAERVRRSELGRELMAQRRADGPGWRLID